MAAPHGLILPNGGGLALAPLSAIASHSPVCWLLRSIIWKFLLCCFRKLSVMITRTMPCLRLIPAAPVMPYRASGRQLLFVRDKNNFSLQLLHRAQLQLINGSVSTDGGKLYLQQPLPIGCLLANCSTVSTNATATTARSEQLSLRCCVAGLVLAAIANTSAAVLTVNTAIAVSTNPANSLVCENGSIPL